MFIDIVILITNFTPNALLKEVCMRKEIVQSLESSQDSFDKEAIEGFSNIDWPSVSVEWVDAESDGGPGWQDPEDMIEYAKRPLPIMKTVGMLVWEDNEKVVITDSKGPASMGGVTKIPRAWIRSYYILNKVENKLLPVRDEKADSPRLVG